MRRLLFYYPKSGEEMIRKLFARPLYDSDVVEEFAAEPDPDKWKVRAADFRKKHGDGAANAVPGELWSQANLYDEGTKRKAARDRAEKIFTNVYPNYDHSHPPFINAVTAYEQMQLVQEFAGSGSATVEKLILDVFRAVVRNQSTSKMFWYKLDHLAFTCMSQLIGRGYDEEFNNFLAARVKAIEAGDMDFFERCELRDIREWQKQLAK